MVSVIVACTIAPPHPPVLTDGSGILKTFGSDQELVQFLQDRQSMSFSAYRSMIPFISAPVSMSDVAEKSSGMLTSRPAYSTTNVQVTGVDEPDFVKTDGNHVYVLSKNKIILMNSRPADAHVLSSISVSNDEYIQNMFVSGDKLVVFGTRNIPLYYDDGPRIAEASKIAVSEMARSFMPQPYQPSAFLDAYDITDRSSPVRSQHIIFNGNYITSRLMDSTVYVFLQSNPLYDEKKIELPVLEQNSVKTPLVASDIHYFDMYDQNYQLTTLLSLNLKTETVQRSTYLLGASNTLYVSENNAYVSYRKNPSPIFVVGDLFAATRQFLPAEALKEIALAQKVLSKTQAASRTLEIIQQNSYSNTPTAEEIHALVQKMIPLLSVEQAAKARAIEQSDLTLEQKTDYLKRVFMPALQNIPNEDSRLADIKTFSEAAEKKAQERQQHLQEAVQKAQQKMMEESDATVIAKFALRDGKIMFSALGEVKGTLLNQFSLDEYENKLRVATTHQTRDTTANNVYVLDSKLDLISALEGLEPKERIYAARFVENKLFLVTFRQIDPLFVIDLSGKPRVLGELHIPGFSEYLHPYDENHIIGVGRDADPQTGRQGGVKLALFDILDVTNPIQKAVYKLGDGSDSEALRDHKAFLFSKEKKLLVIPVQRWQVFEPLPIMQVDSSKPQIEPAMPAQENFVGAYVFKIDTSGFTLKARITHGNEYDSAIRRSLYIDEALYTVSDHFVNINALGDLHELNSVDLTAIKEPIDYCETNEDCTCQGIDKRTGNCFLGTVREYKQYADTTKDCADFCTGFAGNLHVVCKNNKCVQEKQKDRQEPVCGDGICDFSEAAKCGKCPEGATCMPCRETTCPEDCEKNRPVCGNGFCEDGEADSDGGCGTGADPRCLGSPARKGTCSQDCFVS